MALSVILFTLTITLLLHSALAWKRIGIGRPIWAHTEPPKLIVLSAIGTLAYLDESTGEIQWRLTAPLSVTPVTPRAVMHYQNLLVLALSNDRVRAVGIHDGDVLWELPGCGIAHPSQEQILPIKECDSENYRFVDFKGILTDASVDEPHPILELELHPSTLTWHVGDIVLTAQSDGLLQAKQTGELLWEREEGLSHPLQAEVYVGEKSSVLVVLSGLGALFALKGENGALLWKLRTEGDCNLNAGHMTVAVVSCSTAHAGTTAMAVDTSSGEVLRRDHVDAFVAIRAMLDKPYSNIPILRIVDGRGVEKTLLGDGNPAADGSQDRPWLIYSKHGTSISANHNGTTLWHVNMPSSARIEAVAKAQRLHPASSRVRPPAVRVTGDRRLLYKYVDPNLALVLAHDAEATETYAMLLDTETGAVHDITTHPATALPASAVKGESWFAYTLWSTVAMQQEVHIVDLYQQPRNISWLQAAIRSSVSKSLGPRIMYMLDLLTRESTQCSTGATSASGAQCAADVVPDFSMPDGPPYVVRSSSLLTQRVRALDLTQTKKGLTEPAVIMTLESGQVTLVSKFLLDARRPKETNAAYEDEYILQYQPVISLHSHSRDSRYIDEGNHVPGVKITASAPHHKQESICQIAVIGTDVVYSLEFPAGNYDSLPDDFFYSGVLGMLMALAIAFIYTRDLNAKAILAKSW